MAVVARRTGLSPDVVRAWERRHRAVSPARTGGNRRLYSDEDVERLLLLKRAVDAGWPIGHVAPLGDAEIRSLVRSPAGPATPAAGGGERAAELLEACHGDVTRLDGAGLERHLEEAAVELGRVEVLDSLLVPLFRRIGDECSAGTMRIAAEHVASAEAARFLASLHGAEPPAEDAPAIVVTTPLFQHHALGALLVAATARLEGWRTTYLGPNLPAEEIAAAARRKKASAVALSVTHPPGDPALAADLERLGRLLPPSAELWVGGAGASSHRRVLDAIGGRLLRDLAALRDRLRARPAARPPGAGPGRGGTRMSR